MISISKILKLDEPLTENMLFKIPERMAKYLGPWPKYSTLKLTILTTITIVSTLWAKFTQWLFMVSHLKAWKEHPNWLEMVDSFVTTMILSVSILKIFYLAAGKKNLIKIMDYLKEVMLNPKLHAESKKFNSFRCKLAHFLNVNLVAFGFATCTFYVSIPIIINIIRVSKGLPIIRQMAVPVQYPWDTQSEPGYSIAFLFSSYIAYLVVMMFSTADGFFLSLCFYLSAQFKNIQIEIKYLFEDALGSEHISDPLKLTNEENKKIIQKLKEIIISHTKAIEMCECMVKTFIPIILAHFFSASLMICLASLAIVVAPGVEVMIFFFFVSDLLIQLYVYCASGTFIVDSSTKIAEVAYSLDWYKADIKFQKMLLLVIQRAQNGSHVKVPFFEPSAPTFLSIISTAASYITLLKTFL